MSVPHSTHAAVRGTQPVISYNMLTNITIYMYSVYPQTETRTGVPVLPVQHDCCNTAVQHPEAWRSQCSRRSTGASQDESIGVLCYNSTLASWHADLFVWGVEVRQTTSSTYDTTPFRSISKARLLLNEGDANINYSCTFSGKSSLNGRDGSNETVFDTVRFCFCCRLIDHCWSNSIFCIFENWARGVWYLVCCIRIPLTCIICMGTKCSVGEWNKKSKLSNFQKVLVLLVLIFGASSSFHY